MVSALYASPQHRPQWLISARSTDPARDRKIHSELNAATKKIQDLGAIICDPADIPSVEE